MFGISKNVKYIAVAPGASKLPALKKVRPCRGLNPGCPCSLVNIENEEEFGVYSEQKTDLLLEKSFRKCRNHQISKMLFIFRILEVHMRK